MELPLIHFGNVIETNISLIPQNQTNRMQENSLVIEAQIKERWYTLLTITIKLTIIKC